MVGGRFTGCDGLTRELTKADFMVVTPYNAQVRRVRQELDRAGLRGVQVGAVYKFQG